MKSRKVPSKLLSTIIGFSFLLCSNLLYAAEILLGAWDLDGSGRQSQVYSVTSGLSSSIKIVFPGGQYSTFAINGSSWSILNGGVTDLDGVAGAEIALSIVSSSGSYIGIVHPKRNTLGLYQIGTQTSLLSWANMAIADFDGVPGADILINVTSSSSQEYRIIKNYNGVIANSKYTYSRGDSLIVLKGGIIDADNQAGKEIVLNRNGTYIDVIHAGNGRVYQYAIGSGLWSIIGYSDLNGVSGNEIVLAQGSSIKVINVLKDNIRTFDVGASYTWAFSRFENVDGSPGNEIILNYSGQSRVIAYGSDVSDVGAFRHVGGLCIHPEGGSSKPVNGTPIVLWTSCTDQRLKFRFLKDGILQHVTSGKCLHPEGGSANPDNWTRLVFWDGCNDPRLRFELLSNGSLRHKSSGKCIHPAGGSRSPEIGTPLVFWDICGEDRLKFDHLISQ